MLKKSPLSQPGNLSFLSAVQHNRRQSLNIYWASTPGHGLRIFIQLTLKNTTTDEHDKSGIDTSDLLTIITTSGISGWLFNWLGCSYSSWIKNVSSAVSLRAWLWLDDYQKPYILLAYIWIKKEDQLRTFVSCDRRVGGVFHWIESVSNYFIPLPLKIEFWYSLVYIF